MNEIQDRIIIDPVPVPVHPALDISVTVCNFRKSVRYILRCSISVKKYRADSSGQLQNANCGKIVWPQY